MLSARFVKSATRPDQYPRMDLPGVAFAGRSNVGKSSAINCLLGRKRLARISSTPGRTQVINFFSIDETWMLIDLPGYGYAKVPSGVRQDWALMIEEFFASHRRLQLTVILVDARHEPSERDRQMISWLVDLGLAFQVVATKIDKISKNHRVKSLKAIRDGLQVPEVLPFSATTGEGRKELWKIIQSIR